MKRTTTNLAPCLKVCLSLLALLWAAGHITSANAATLKERVALASKEGAPVNALSDAEFDAFLAHVVKGQTEWINMLPAFSKNTDGYVAESLSISLAEAILHNPTAVLRVADDSGLYPTLDLDHVCGVPFIEISWQEVRDYQQKANASLATVTAPDVSAKKAACLNMLNRPLPAEAEDEGDGEE